MATIVVLDLGEAVVAGFGGYEGRAVDLKDFVSTLKEIDAKSSPDASDAYDITRIPHDLDRITALGTSHDDVVDLALACLAAPICSPMDRDAAILAAQQAPVAEWVRYANVMLDLRARGEVADQELQWSIYPRPYISNHGAADFWRPSVRHVLYRLYFAKGVDANIRRDIVLDLLGVGGLLHYLFYCQRCA